MPFKHIFFQAVMCCSMSRSTKKYDDVLKMASLCKKLEMRPLFWRSRSAHPEARRFLPSTYMISVGYLITLCWLSCLGSCQSVGFWESAFPLRLSPRHRVGFHFVRLNRITTVQSQQFEITGCVYQFLFFI